MLKSCLLGGVLITAAPMASLGQAQQPPSPALDGPTVHLGIHERCADVPVDVMATSSERRLACDAAKSALQLLARCGISPRRPLTLEMAGEVRRPFGGAIFGMFDPKQEKVFLIRYDKVMPLVSGTPYSQLSQEDFYKGLIVHEVVHAVMHQNYKRHPRSHAAYEYPAYALQVASFPPDVREKFLQTINIGADENQLAFSDAILSFDPFFFAARAYEHFKTSVDGCAHLRALLEGDVVFIWTRP